MPSSSAKQHPKGYGLVFAVTSVCRYFLVLFYSAVGRDAGHSYIPSDLGCWFNGLDEFWCGVMRICQLVKVGRRPPGSRPVVRRLISNSIWARASLAVKAMAPVGVLVSTSPPRFRKRSSIFRVRSSSARSSIFGSNVPVDSK